MRKENKKSKNITNKNNNLAPLFIGDNKEILCQNELN